MTTVLLEIKDSKAPFIMELLDNFSFVKTKPSLHETKETVNSHDKDNFFANCFGMWEDRDIDAETLRKQTWGIE